MVKLIIAGSRGCNDYCEVRDVYKSWAFYQGKPDVIISGDARGADRLGKRIAREEGIALKVMPADWERHGRSAGFLRNAEMAKEATHLLAFWDGSSRGTKHMIDEARRKGLHCEVYTNEAWKEPSQ